MRGTCITKYQTIVVWSRAPPKSLLMYMGGKGDPGMKKGHYYFRFTIFGAISKFIYCQCAMGMAVASVKNRSHGKAYLWTKNHFVFLLRFLLTIPCSIKKSSIDKEVHSLWGLEKILNLSILLLRYFLSFRSVTIVVAIAASCY